MKSDNKILLYLPFFFNQFSDLISVIIPTLNESASIHALVTTCFHYAKEEVEVIVCDGGSVDDTVRLAKLAGAQVLPCERKGRASQMNAGAQIAKGDVFYFVHADVKIHSDYEQDLYTAVKEGYALGCYRFRFDSNRLLLKINAFFTRFDFIWCRGGDQTLFMTKECYNTLGGFRSDFLIMEDYDLIVRAQQTFPFKIIPKPVIVSARKYENNGYFRVQWANLTIMRMWKKGASQREMADTYRKLLDYR